MKSYIFVLLLTYGGAAIALFRPYVGFLIYLAFAILRPEYLWEYSVPPGNYSRTVAIGFLIGWVLRGCGSWRFGKGWVVIAPLAGYWAWAGASSTQAAVSAEAALSYMDILSKIVIPVIVATTMIDDAAKIRQLLWVMVGCQGYVCFEFNLSYLKGDLFMIDDWGAMGRAVLATGYVMTTVAGLFLALQEQAAWRKALALGCCLMMLHGILLTYSRGGLLALIVAGAATFLLIPKRPKHVLIAALIAAAGLRLAGPQVAERFQTTFADEAERDESANARLQVWGEASRLIPQHPVLGVGPANFMRMNSLHLEAHNTWIQAAVEVGIPGLLLLLLAYASCALRLLPLTRERRAGTDPFLRDVARLSIAAIVGFGAASMFVSVTQLETPYFFLLAGAAALKLDSAAPPIPGGD